ncbi:MAG: DEAD/DEAH box helicase [Pseudomonadota bacterium]
MSFKNFNFHQKITAGIVACGYTVPTPIQKEAIPPILAGKDIFGLAQTGTGKTAAFVLPLLQRLLDSPTKREQALIMAPTRELAEQIHDNIIKMSQSTGLKSVVIYGGVSKQPQIRAIRNGVDIIVACPGRLLDLLNDKRTRLGNVKLLILDEADHMLDKGFLPDIQRIIKLLPVKRQSLVFSATMPKEIKILAENILQNPITIQVRHNLPAPTISHALFQIAKESKTDLLKKILQDSQMKCTLVFTRTKHKAKNLARQLENSGLKAASIQGNLSQTNRQKALNGFKDGTYNILVATDIAARGIDVIGISHVINFDMPDTVEAYTHRTGRTGRASRTGQAISFVSQEDNKMLSLIERNLGKKMQNSISPSFVAAPVKKAYNGKKETVTDQRYKSNRSTQIKRPKRCCTWSESLVLA